MVLMVLGREERVVLLAVVVLQAIFPAHRVQHQLSAQLSASTHGSHQQQYCRCRHQHRQPQQRQQQQRQQQRRQLSRQQCLRGGGGENTVLNTVFDEDGIDHDCSADETVTQDYETRKKARLKNWKRITKKRELEKKIDKIVSKTGESLQITCKDCGVVSNTYKAHNIHLRNCVGPPDLLRSAERNLKKNVLPKISSALFGANTTTKNNDEMLDRVVDALAKQLEDKTSSRRKTDRRSDNKHNGNALESILDQMLLSDPLPEGWKEYTDKKSGRPYYHNKATKKTTWVRPTVHKSDDDSDGSENTEKTSANLEPLREGWNEVKDHYGNVKYYHKRLHLFRTERPVKRSKKQAFAEMALHSKIKINQSNHRDDAGEKMKEKKQTAKERKDVNWTAPAAPVFKPIIPSSNGSYYGTKVLDDFLPSSEAEPERNEVFISGGDSAANSQAEDPLDEYMRKHVDKEHRRGVKAAHRWERMMNRRYENMKKKGILPVDFDGDTGPGPDLKKCSRMILPEHKIKIVIGKRGKRIEMIQKMTRTLITVSEYSNVTNLTSLLYKKDPLESFIERIKEKGLLMRNASYVSNRTSTLYIFGPPKRIEQAQELITQYLDNYKARMQGHRGGTYKKKAIQKAQIRETFKLRHTYDYEILECPFGAKRKDVEKAYKRMRIKWHPDKYKAKGNYTLAHIKYKEIQQAYERLTNLAEHHELYVLTHSKGEVDRYIKKQNVTFPMEFYTAEGQMYERAKRRLGLPTGTREMKKLLEWWDPNVPLKCLGGGKIWLSDKIQNKATETSQPLTKRIGMSQKELEARNLHFQYGDMIVTNRSGLEGKIGVCMSRPLEGVGVVVEFGPPIGRRMVPEGDIQMYKKRYVVNETAVEEREKEEKRLRDLSIYAEASLQRTLDRLAKATQAPTPAPVYTGEIDPDLAGQMGGDALD